MSDNNSIWPTGVSGHFGYLALSRIYSVEMRRRSFRVELTVLDCQVARVAKVVNALQMYNLGHQLGVAGCDVVDFTQH